MVQAVTIPLSWANATPGVSGVEDVSFDVPQLDDIRETIDGTLPDEDDIRQVVRAELEGIAGEDLVDVDLSSLDASDLGADAIADAVLDRLAITPGLFGPIDDPLDEVIRRAVREGLAELGELDVDLGAVDAEVLLDIPDAVDALRDDIEGLQDAVEDGLSVGDLPEVPTVEDIRQATQQAVTDAVSELPGGTLLTDPDTFVDEQAARLRERLVSEEAVRELIDALEGSD